MCSDLGHRRSGEVVLELLFRLSDILRGRGNDDDRDGTGGSLRFLHRLRSVLRLVLLHTHALPFLLDTDVPVCLVERARIHRHVFDQVLEDRSRAGEVACGP